MLTILSRMAFFVGLLAVIILSVIPKEAVPSLGLPDILKHMVAYAALALTGGIAVRRARSVFMLAAGLLLLGAGLELVQGLLPGRDASGYEFLANMVGIALGSTAAISANTVLNRHPQILG